ncbi:chemotaxis protein [Terasakiella sp. SH-1]|uniref:chemotaxis protein n=1 Tax=Terasakiella sp. SH-1 TaxID=2560057 RepID=UPI001073ACE5|nr:chemotaxis protein [Terasakiella sp. SH-1]
MQDTVSSYAMEAAGQQAAQYQQELFGQCRNTFEAFQGLGDVAEDMRILSLNAELAAGRAGTYGVSIRALTQYTRELVNRLEQINLEMQKVESFGAGEEASDAAEQVESAIEENAEAVAAVEEETTIDDIASALQKFANDNGGVKYLNEQAKRIAEVVSQSNSIATNMAIEAATAGQYEETFTNVANDMRGFVDTLKNMVTRAQDSIEKAFRAEKSLKEIEASGR